MSKLLLIKSVIGLKFQSEFNARMKIFNTVQKVMNLIQIAVHDSKNIIHILSVPMYSFPNSGLEKLLLKIGLLLGSKYSLRVY